MSERKGTSRCSSLAYGGLLVYLEFIRGPLEPLGEMMGVRRSLFRSKPGVIGVRFFMGVFPVLGRGGSAEWDPGQGVWESWSLRRPESPRR